MPRPLRRLVVLAGALALLPAAPASATPAATQAAAATATTTSASHPYGDPVWFPLRKPALVGCAKDACTNNKRAHGYWALDFNAAKGDPVHAAGAGIAHVGGNTGGCAPQGSGERDGRWVWIDHGGGVVTRYHHLSKVRVTDGQRVTPATRIGDVGSTGGRAPCSSTNYLHVEVRHGGLKGARANPGELRACVGGRRVTFPDALGGSGWDDPRVHPDPRTKTLTSTSSCISPDWLRTPAKASASVARGSKQATVSWGRPTTGTDRVRVWLETYHSSTKAWGNVRVVTVAGTTTRTVLAGLENGRRYRVSVAFHNAYGTGLSSPKRAFTPAGVPGKTRAPRYLTWPKADYVHYGWYRAAHNGSPLTGFNAARRCAKGDGAYGGWKASTVRVKDAYYNFRGLKGYDRCQVRVRAGNAVGAGPWSVVSTVRR